MAESEARARLFDGDASQVMAWLRAHQVELVRVEICDLAGIAHGKAVTLPHFERVLAQGPPMCAASCAADVEMTVVRDTAYAGSIGFADFIARSNLSSLRLLRHQPHTALVLCDACWRARWTRTARTRWRLRTRRTASARPAGTS
ncbi:MAG: hypothetical protein IH800_14295 [Myxococcales bacterium]|nr:hypothetical protein [Myxococcales bacterium]